MFCGIKIQNLLVSVAGLLDHPRLTFPLPVDERTGAVLIDRTRYATDRGLTFALVPTKADRSRYRVELSGSLHRYSRGGLHNADDFTADEVAAAVDALQRTYGIDAPASTLNNLEFGVNLALPFPAADLLRALLCYRGVPFVYHTENGFTYYQAAMSQYVVKIYDKGTEYAFTGHVVRVEVKVLKMAYLHRQGIAIRTLADLTNPTHYPALGTLLAETFGAVLFDEPTVSKTDVPDRDREFLLEARDPRYWQLPKGVSKKEYDRQQKRLRRDETRFRNLLATHRPGRDWQGETAALLRQTWAALTKSDGGASRGTPAAECPKLTGVAEGAETGRLSEINPLDVVLISDMTPNVPAPVPPLRGTPDSRELAGNFFRPTATQLRANPTLLAEVERGRKRYAKGSREDAAKRAAHNLRNDESNPRNNLKRSIRRIDRYPILPGLDVAGTLRLSEEQQRRLGGENCQR
jgi:hypothetical protein